MSTENTQKETPKIPDEEMKTLQVDPNILIECIDYTSALVNGYVDIYQNFQKILWTMHHRGMSAQDAANAAMAIMKKASDKASSLVPHKDPFVEEESPENEE